MEAPWMEGDTASAVCPGCKDLVIARIVRRPMRFPRTCFLVGNLLVQVCEVCDTLLGIPRQSVAQLREAGSK